MFGKGNYTLMAFVEPRYDSDKSESEFNIKQFYERNLENDNYVTLTAVEKLPFNLVRREMKVIEIGPDPALCNKRYIWGRKSKYIK